MSRWGKFLLLYLGGVVISLSQLKVPPVMTELSRSLDVSVSNLSWLMSIFTISGIFIAIPGGMVVSKIGAKKLLLLITGCLVIGNLGGAFVSNFYLLLISRAIEGISFSTIVMTGVVLINYWFRDSKGSGTAIGIFTTFSALGSLIAMNIFAPMAEQFGIKSLWYFTAILASALFVFFFLFLDGPEIAKESRYKNKGLFSEAIRNRSIWLLAIMQGSMAFLLFTFISLYPLLFTDYYGLAQNIANFYTSLFGLFGLPFGILAGYLIDKTGKPGLIIFTAFLLMTASCFCAVYLSGTTYIIQIFVLSVSVSLASSAITIMVPRIVSRDELIGYSISFVNLLYYLGIFAGAPIITKLIEFSSWKLSILVLTIITSVGGVASLLFIIQSRKQFFLEFNRGGIKNGKKI